MVVLAGAKTFGGVCRGFPMVGLTDFFDSSRVDGGASRMGFTVVVVVLKDGDVIFCDDSKDGEAD